MYPAAIKLLLSIILTATTLVAVSGQSNSNFTFYDLPAVLSGPCDLCEGPDGALWGQDQLGPSLFRIDPANGNIETYTIPFTLEPFTNVTLPSALGRTAFSCAIRPGDDGNVYASFGTRNQLVRINPSSKKIEVFGPPNLIDQPAGDLQPFNDLYSSPAGIYFTQTTAGKVSFFEFSTEKITNYNIPTPASMPLGIFFSSDGKVYFAEFGAQKIGRLDPATGAIEEFEVPVPALAGPAVIRVETEGRYIWFTAFAGNAIGRLDMMTGEVTAYSNPSVGTFAAEDTLGADGNIYFSTPTQNYVNKLDPATGDFSQILIPGTTVAEPVSEPLYFVIAMNAGPGNAIWFTEETTNRVGRYELP
ncbi:hypothetical protein MMC10_010080 [Thelotrema lepadinum]|nr:hypothetical protein [Thelotrema lepadinum]